MFHFNRIVFVILVPSAAATSERPVCVTPESGHGLLWLSQRLLIYAPAGIQQSWPHLRCCSQQLVKPQKKKPWRERVCLAYLGFLCALLRNVNVYERQEIFFFFTVVSVCVRVCLHSDWCLLVFVFWCQHYLLTVSTARRRSLTLVCAGTAASSLSLLHISCSFLFVCDRKQPLSFSCVFCVVIY